MADELAAYGLRLQRLAGPAVIKRMGFAAGIEGKKAASTVVSSRLGGDMRLSGIRSKRAELKIGFDVDATDVEFKFRPAGLWSLATWGRRRTVGVYPRVNGRKRRTATYRRAVRTPEGLRARSSAPAQSRTPRALNYAGATIRRVAPRAASKELGRAIARFVRSS